MPIGLVADPARAAPARRERTGPSEQARPAGPRPRQRRPARDRLGPRPRQRPGLDEPGDRRRARRRRSSSWSRSCSGSCAPRRRCCRCASSATATFAADERRVAADVLRDVRLDLPARAVLPDGAGLLAVRLRPADPAVDGDADLRRPDRRRALGPDRRAAADGARARRCRRSASAGWRRSARRRRRTREFVAPVRDLRHRHGALLRAGRERRALVGAGRRRRARRRAPTTRSASSAACSASRCSPRSSRTTAATAPAQAFVDGLEPGDLGRRGGRRALGAVAALAIPRRGADGRRRTSCALDSALSRASLAQSIRVRAHGPARSVDQAPPAARGLGRRHRLQRGGLASRSSTAATVAALEGRDFELIFVDDGSTDGSFASVERLHAARRARPRRAAEAELRPAPGDARRARRAPAARSS